MSVSIEGRCLRNALKFSDSVEDRKEGKGGGEGVMKVKREREG